VAVRQKSGIEPVTILGQRLLGERNQSSAAIKAQMDALGKSWKMLKAAVAQREVGKALRG